MSPSIKSRSAVEFSSKNDSEFCTLELFHLSQVLHRLMFFGDLHCFPYFVIESLAIVKTAITIKANTSALFSSLNINKHIKVFDKYTSKYLVQSVT